MANVPNVIVYLVGFAGTGKLAVARELAPLIDATIVDNHWINNPIFGLLRSDGMTKFPDAVWTAVAKVRDAVLETIATLSPRDASFIFTHDGRDDEPEDRAIYDAFRTTAECRNALFIPIRLICETDELARRIVMPGRKERHKSINPQSAREVSRTQKVLDPQHANGLTLDVTNLPPRQAAAVIHQRIIQLRA
jgi:hypothetical protein